MLQIYSVAETECGYRPTFLLRMVHEHGGVQAAKKLIRAKKQSEGFTRLWELNRLDLSVEAVALEEQWRPLFEVEELEIARRRLQQAGLQLGGMTS
jgi:hypothetical protein